MTLRRAAAAILAAAALAGCSDPPAQPCPGEPVARFVFSGPRIFRGDPALAGLDPVLDVEDCNEQVGPPPFPPSLGGFDGLLAVDPATQVAALCRDQGFVLFGQRSGTRYSVEGSTDGAVLSSCSPTCAATLRLVVAGDVRGGGDVPLSFAGVLVEVMTRAAGDCGACNLSAQPPACAARYQLSSAL